MALADFLDRLGTTLGGVPPDAWSALAQGLTSPGNFAQGLAKGVGGFTQQYEGDKRRKGLAAAIDAQFGDNPLLRAYSEADPMGAAQTIIPEQMKMQQMQSQVGMLQNLLNPKPQGPQVGGDQPGQPPAESGASPYDPRAIVSGATIGMLTGNERLGNSIYETMMAPTMEGYKARAQALWNPPQFISSSGEKRFAWQPGDAAGQSAYLNQRSAFSPQPQPSPPTQAAPRLPPAASGLTTGGIQQEYVPGAPPVGTRLPPATSAPAVAPPAQSGGPVSVLSPVRLKELEAMGGANAQDYADARHGITAADAGDELIVPMQTALQEMIRTGSGTGYGTQAGLKARQAMLSSMEAMGIPANSEMAKWVANADLFQKNANKFAFELVKTLGAREAASVVQIGMQSMPNLEMDTQGNVNIISLLKHGLDRQREYGNFAQQWGSTHDSLDGMRQAFNSEHPVEEYVSQVKPLAWSASAKPSTLKNNATYQFMGKDGKPHLVKWHADVGQYEMLQ